MNVFKKIKRYLFSNIATAIMITIIITVIPGNVCAASSVSANYYNVMLVIDGSGSLVSSKNGTDLEGYRYVAAELFLGLLTDSGNNVGAIVFDDGILVDTGIKKMSGSEAKKKLFNQIDGQVNSNGGTNIGMALEQAVNELIEVQEENGLPSVIVMLTDGKTDLDSDPDNQSDSEKKALKKEANAIKSANKNNIVIYSVLLNGNGNGSDEEIRAMANDNKDQYAVVTSAKDIQDTFAMFYTMIYGSFSSEKDATFDPDGNAEVKIDVPTFGVEEVNVVIKTESELEDDAITVMDPENQKMDEDDLDDALTASKGFNLIKITEPESGTWIVKIKGIPGDSVSFDYVYNDNVSIKLKDLTKKNTYFSENTVTLGAELYSGKELVPSNVLDPSYVTLELTSTNGEPYKVNPDVKVTETGYELTFDIPSVDTGTDMTASAIVCIPIGTLKEGITAVSTEVHLAVNPISENHIPVPIENPMTVEVEDSGDGKAYYDLNSWFSDEDEGDVISYSLVSSDYSDEALFINDENILIAEAKGMLSGTATIRATDENGGYSILNVEFLGNNAPVAAKDSTTVTITKQFGASKTEEVDITDWFSDEDGDELLFSIVDSDYSNDEIDLSGTTLTIDRTEIERGSIVIRAQDSEGAFCECTVHFKIRNLALWESAGALIILGIVALILIILSIIAAKRKFKGVIEVEAISQGRAGKSTFGGVFGGGFENTFGNGASVVQKDVFGPFHGKRYVRTIMVDNGGLDGKAKFTVVSSKKAQFSSPKPFYISGGIEKKKLGLPIGMDIEIYSDAECTKGIHVSVKEDNMGVGMNPYSVPPTGGNTFGGGW